MNNWILYMKVLCLSAVAILIKFTVCSDVVSSFLKPPYLFILLNAIIIAIAVSSRFQRIQPNLISVATPPSDFAWFSLGENALPPRDDIDLTFPYEEFERRVPVSWRSDHRKSNRLTSHRLRTQKVVEHETLDTIWNKITREGGSLPEPSQEVRGRLAARPLPPSNCLSDHVTKLMSVDEQLNNQAVRRREPSLSRHELNSRAEAFLKKVQRGNQLGWKGKNLVG